jgi:hypothetical protein
MNKSDTDASHKSLEKQNEELLQTLGNLSS